MIKDLDIVMHKNFYLMYCGYTHGDVKHERGVFSFATLKRMTERVHNNEKILPLEEHYCIDYYIPACRPGRNPYGQAETGYGKTAEKR